MNPAEELKNQIDSAIETKATEVAEKSAEALEAKAAELNNEVSEVKSQNELLQKQLDDVKSEVKSFNVTKMAKPTSEFSEMLREKANDIASLKKGQSVTLDLKDFGSTSGAASAPYGDERVSDIKYDPNFSNRVRQHLMTGSTSQTGAIRHTFEQNEVDTSGGKAKGSGSSSIGSTGSTRTAITAHVGSAVYLQDVHTPIQTLWNFLTIPQEQLDDIAMIESYLSTRLMANLMDVEDVQLLRGSGTGSNYNGLATAKRAFADAAARETYIGGIADSVASAANVNNYEVITAVAAGMANENYVADKVFINPLDYYAMVLSKDADRNYVLQQTMAPNGEFKTIWSGIEFIKTPAQTAGTFTLIDSKQATQYWLRDGSSVEFGMNDDDFSQNNITVRASIRGALTNYKSNGIVSETFANFATAIGTSA